LEETNLELSRSRIINHGRSKPFGYSGDFQMIDWTYTKMVDSTDPRGEMWDRFYHRQIAPLAVCARKDRFGDVLRSVSLSAKSKISVLNVGSGPAREILDGAIAANLNPGDLRVICLDADKVAIEYAKRLLGPSWEAHCHFEHRNALRYRPRDSFDLVWSSGLFDYLDERLAIHLIKLLWGSVKVGGRMVIGNFAETHSTRSWIEWCGDWFLNHRDRDDMQRLTDGAGISDGNANISHAVDEFRAVRYLELVKIADG